MTGIDPTTLAGTRAKGKRPHFFKDRDVERLLNITMALAMEQAVTRQRLDALERVLAQKGLLDLQELARFTPDPEAEAQRTLWMKEYIARVLRIVQQETEAMESGAMDVPMEEVMEQLRNI